MKRLSRLLEAWGADNGVHVHIHQEAENGKNKPTVAGAVVLALIAGVVTLVKELIGD